MRHVATQAGLVTGIVLCLALTQSMAPSLQPAGALAKDEKGEESKTEEAPPRTRMVASARPEMIDARTEAAIQKGVDYLAKTQSRDGSWRSKANYGTYPCAMTALSGLALLSAGHTPTEGKYAANVRKATSYVLSCANPSTGLIAKLHEEQRPMYAHGYSLLFLAQVYGMERDPAIQNRIRIVLTKAVQLTERSQSQWGGWLYTPDSNGDEGSVTITQVQGLRACRNAGINVPKKVIDNAIKYIVKSANPDGGIRYTARSGGSSRPAITAQAVAALNNAGEYEHPVAQKSLAYIKKLMKGGNTTSVFGGHSTYATFYTAQAMFMSGDEDWKWYFPKLKKQLLGQQNADGSWRGDYVGEVYGTSVNVMVLSLPYGYLPIFQR